MLTFSPSRRMAMSSTEFIPVPKSATACGNARYCSSVNESPTVGWSRHTAHIQSSVKSFVLRSETDLPASLLSAAVPMSDISAVIKGLDQHNMFSLLGLTGSEPAPKDPPSGRTGPASIVRPIR